ncbi:MAG: hypothetical protein ACRD3E_08615 [Terriglobales bacterium]
MTSVAKVPANLPARAPDKRPRPRLTLAHQLRAMVPVIVYGVLLVALAIAVVFVPMHQRAAADPDPVVRALFAAQLFRIEVLLAPLVLLSGAIASVAALLRARRAASSMDQLREAMARLAVGDAETPVFANSDEFHRFEPPFTGIVKRIEQLTRGNLEMLRFFRHNLEGLSQRLNGPGRSDAELRESLQVLIRDVDAEIKKLQMKS